MKAFGVRLAAGVVTILTGAIMAAQSQKEKLAATESAWTEESIPPAKPVMPVGLSDLASDENQSDSNNFADSQQLVSADPDEASALKPFSADDQDPGNDRSVRLVQHTETVQSAGPSSVMGLPNELPSSSASAPSMSSGPTMELPSFDEVPPMDSSNVPPAPQFADARLQAPPVEYDNEGDAASADAGQGPGFAVGMLGQARMSSIQIADTPNAQAAPNVDPSQQPVNDLRSGGPATDTAFAGSPKYAGTISNTGIPNDSNQGFDSPASMNGYGGSEYHNEADFAPIETPGLADTANAASAQPSSMLAPVLPGNENQAIRLAEAPASTIRINRDSGFNPAMNSQQNHASSATIGFASAPKIVGGTDGSDVEYAQTAGQFEIPSEGLPAGNMPPANAMASPRSTATPDFALPAQGYPNPSSPGQGFSAEQPNNGAAAGQSPMSYGMGDINPQNPSLQGSPSQGMPMQNNAASNGFDAPNMRMSTPQTATIGGSSMPSEMPSGYANAQPLPPLPSTNPANSSVYHPAGFKRQQDMAQNVSGATMASPGGRNLDGPQAPSVVIEKRAPQEVKVGKPASFVITVRNVGNAKALNVQVFDQVPTGTVLTDATPTPSPKYQPELYWELGDLEAGQERTITLQLTPQQEGELGSVARVAFQAAAGVRTVSTRPELKVIQRAPEEVLIGQQLEIELEVSNPGSGEATGVLLQEDVPEGLSHPAGKQLDNMIGALRPGEVRRQILRMKAVKAGMIQNTIRVKGDDGLETTHTVAVNVIAPDLQLSLAGPSRRYLERQATYELRIDNVGTAPADNVDLSMQLDRGFTFVKTNYEGQYDPARHAVFWSLEKLPAGEWGKVEVTLLPVEEGNRVLRSEARADLGQQTVAESQVVVDSLAELTFSIADTADPIEVGGVTTYEIRVTNTGSRDDNNVNVAVQLPPQMQIAEQGDFTSQGNGVITFAPRALLKANDEVVYQLKVKGGAPGRHLIKAIVASDQSAVQVAKEESTMVYADR
ncbi:DUF11 domain-containing protein [Stieleria sp. JC731]|uniref:DUF11 domain-containing protein n=1 Tax=Pirellulaceae TaxID=2691357 RepID=UPI001E59564B|nr:DUF11 domain-containing protein [Stieleria sp. JC731]MCC9602432.1 DUF11 domain-containing protein [Stieleria sp. JC731]